MALGVDNFCWHHWEEPAYNKALNLREGLKVCSKCGSIKGFKRWVPREYENLGLKAPDHQVVSVVQILINLVVIGIGFAVLISFLISLAPMLKNSIVFFTSDTDLPPSWAASLMVVFIVGPLLVFVGSVISAFRKLGSEEDSKVLNRDEEYEP